MDKVRLIFAVAIAAVVVLIGLTFVIGLGIIGAVISLFGFVILLAVGLTAYVKERNEEQ